MEYYKHYKKWHDHTKSGYIEGSKKRFKNLFQGILPENKDAKILEVGCANGMALLTLKELGYYNVKGIELSTQLANIAKSFELEVIEGDALELVKTETEKYDLVFMIDVLEHLPVDKIYSFLRDTYKILKDKGRLMLIVPNAISPAGSYYRYIDWTHQISFTPTSISYLLENAGFSRTIIKEYPDEKKPNPNDFKKEEWYKSALSKYEKK